MPWGVAIGAVASIAGAAISSSGAQSAADTQAQASQNASNAQLQMFNQTQQNLQPFIQSGQNALPALQSQLGIGQGGSFNPNAPLMAPFSASQYQQSPGYGFQMGQGIAAVENSASARGGIHGGNTLAALTEFGQGLANSDYQQAYQNYVNQQQQQYGMLNNLVGSGQNAAAGLGGISQQVGRSVGSNMTDAGSAIARGQLASSNAITGGINSLAQIANLYGSGSYGGAGGGAGGGFAGYGGYAGSNNAFNSSFFDPSQQQPTSGYLQSNPGLY